MLFYRMLVIDRWARFDCWLTDYWCVCVDCCRLSLCSYVSCSSSGTFCGWKGNRCHCWATPRHQHRWSLTWSAPGSSVEPLPLTRNNQWDETIEQDLLPGNRTLGLHSNLRQLSHTGSAVGWSSDVVPGGHIRGFLLLLGPSILPQ